MQEWETWFVMDILFWILWFVVFVTVWIALFWFRLFVVTFECVLCFILLLYVSFRFAVFLAFYFVDSFFLALFRRVAFKLDWFLVVMSPFASACFSPIRLTEVAPSRCVCSVCPFCIEPFGSFPFCLVFRFVPLCFFGFSRIHIILFRFVPCVHIPVLWLCWILVVLVQSNFPIAHVDVIRA